MAYNISMNSKQLSQGYHTMEIHEKIAVNVVSNGRTFRKVVNIISDGSYDQVNSVVKSYVTTTWKGLKVDTFFWNYA